MEKININNFRRFCIKIFTWGFLGYFMWVFFNSIFRNSNDLIHYNMKKIIPVSIVIMIFMALFVYFMNKVILKNAFFNRNKKICLLITFIIIFIAQVFLAKEIYYEVGWDAGALIRNAKALVENKDSFDTAYFIRFPNNILLLWIEKNIYIFSTWFTNISYEFLLVIINIILIDVSIFLALLLADKLFNDNTIIISYCFAILLILSLPWIVVSYTDSFCMIFPVLNIYLYFKIKEENKIRNKVIFSIIIGVLTIIGYQIKPTAVISLIAIVISAILYSIKDKKSFVLCLSLGACIAASAIATKVIYDNTLYNMQVNGIQFNDYEDDQIPMTHFLMMGLNTRDIENRGTIYGAWRQEDYDITLSCKTKEEKVHANLNEYVSRVRNLGFTGYLNYLSKKGNWMLSDGTFYYGGEGFFAFSEPYSDSNLAKLIQNYFSFEGENYKLQASFREAVWILVLCFIAIPLLFKKKNYESEGLFLIRLTITGITVFLLLFEGRARYFLNHIPLFIILASYGFGRLYEVFINLSKKNIDIKAKDIIIK